MKSNMAHGEFHVLYFCGSRLNVTVIDWISALLFNLDRLWIELISLMQVAVKEKGYIVIVYFCYKASCDWTFCGPHAVSELFL